MHRRAGLLSARVSYIRFTGSISTLTLF
ncbi:MAG: hypothetical protein QOD28_1313, partial [Acidobacteriota bacterium]|nr:hypothetical protein [Acidobacteriota bacterium]